MQDMACTKLLCHLLIDSDLTHRIFVSNTHGLAELWIYVGVHSGYNIYTLGGHGTMFSFPPKTCINQRIKCVSLISLVRVDCY